MKIFYSTKKLLKGNKRQTSNTKQHLQTYMIKDLYHVYLKNSQITTGKKDVIKNGQQIFNRNITK